ncbi:hypothetical protein E4U15_001694 [Claviceps sp. LM218 group G6]|nr:hypothetical protein E4U15_001694 [Claviceps sp. LM218 group G6]
MKRVRFHGDASGERLSPAFLLPPVKGSSSSWVLVKSCGQFGYAALTCVHWISASGLIGVDSIDVADRLRRSGVIYNAEMFESELLNEVIRPRQCYDCHKCTATGRLTLEEHECPDTPGNDSGEVPQLFRAHPAWSRLCYVANTQWTQARSAYSNRPREFTNFQEDDDPFTGGRNNAGDNLSPVASPRKRTRTVLNRPLASASASASASATPTNTQLRTFKLMIRVLYWNTRKRTQLIDIVLNFNVELDVIAIQEVNAGDQISYGVEGCLHSYLGDTGLGSEPEGRGRDFLSLFSTVRGTIDDPHQRVGVDAV